MQIVYLLQIVAMQHFSILLNLRRLGRLIAFAEHLRINIRLSKRLTSEFMYHGRMPLNDECETKTKYLKY